MTTLQTWIDASIDIMKNNIAVLEELREGDYFDKLIIQSYCLKKNIDSFIDFLEKRRKFG